ncbi:hypothetical protein B1756_03680 [Natrarchaeobaculum aegyptiacum]|uniref:DUF1616 domain-containing protein n=2 Tax=Natrarchaeobaculum aegyptiacum TaxID=745377 RepID=A0A2Z2HZ02_9EURY|nr:hypothetical protein B1756_03680 [Natrarchaeobaculum aegyptiacum]
MRDFLRRTVRPSAHGQTAEHEQAPRVPIDLLSATGFVLAALTLIVIVDVGSIARFAIGLPLVLLAPGYALVAILFPRSTPLEDDTRRLLGQTRAIGDWERLALSFGLSVGLLPLIGLTMAALSIPFTGPAVVGSVGVTSVGGLLVATIRRVRVPPTARYHVRLGAKIGAVRRAIFAGSPLYTAINLLLVCSLLVALSSVGFALAAPPSGESYTTLQLLTEDDDGDLVADDYPTDIEPGDPVSLTLAVENQEGEDTDYTVVVQEQWIDGSGGDATVIDRTDHDSADLHVADGETVTVDADVTPEAESGTVRMAVLLFDGDAPDTPTIDDAYRYGYVWVDIEETFDD